MVNEEGFIEASRKKGKGKHLANQQVDGLRLKKAKVQYYYRPTSKPNNGGASTSKPNVDPNAGSPMVNVGSPSYSDPTTGPTSSTAPSQDGQGKNNNLVNVINLVDLKNTFDVLTEQDSVLEPVIGTTYIGLKLHNMQHLRIWMNQFSGPLPPSISNWSDLIMLDLSYNKFPGKIGFSFITTCQSTNFQRNELSLPNGNLEKWLHPCPETKICDTNSQKLNFFQRIVIAIDVAQAVHYLHQGCEKPIVHCDLKPTNILLDEDMVAHVGDFGIAKFFPLEPLNTNQSSLVGFRGTIGYAAPEYGLGSEISRDGDVYSFDIMLLEIMTRKRPTDSMFQGLNLHSYVKTALAHDVIAIVEPTLLDSNKDEEIDEERSCKVNEERTGAE
ncbi:receptor-like protein kinase [Artemisia annua]|uniref:non-specific serine/threonine protein kinase n=1 Tax=Artemisia annua TaxID=35608 RepID=A0A2U1LYZ4_ARTAN|nr:receptor-like protein kinase [Artemisia annua]